MRAPGLRFLWRTWPVTHFLPYLPLVYKDMAYDEITPPSGPAQAFPRKVSNY